MTRWAPVSYTHLDVYKRQHLYIYPSVSLVPGYPQCRKICRYVETKIGRTASLHRHCWNASLPGTTSRAQTGENRWKRGPDCKEGVAITPSQDLVACKSCGGWYACIVLQKQKAVSDRTRPFFLESTVHILKNFAVILTVNINSTG